MIPRTLACVELPALRQSQARQQRERCREPKHARRRQDESEGDVRGACHEIDLIRAVNENSLWTLLTAPDLVKPAAPPRRGRGRVIATESPDPVSRVLREPRGRLNQRHTHTIGETQ